MAGEKEFELGMQFFRDGYVGKALEQMKAAAEAAPKNAIYMSYLGLLVAVAPEEAEAARRALLDAGCSAMLVGEVVEKTSPLISVR